MATHNSVAKSAREAKERRPENYCPSPKCLWRTGGGYCPRHSAPAELEPLENRETRTVNVNGRPILPGARVESCGCIRRFVHGRLQTIQCVNHLRKR